MINVLFLKEKESDSIYAYFPAILEGINKYLCYAHIGQHSACHSDYIKECKEANYNEYSDLLKELIIIGYKNLNILNSQQITYHRKPTKGEIKFGEGATHYLSLPIS